MPSLFYLLFTAGRSMLASMWLDDTIHAVDRKPGVEAAIAEHHGDLQIVNLGHGGRLRHPC